MAILDIFCANSPFEIGQFTGHVRPSVYLYQRVEDFLLRHGIKMIQARHVLPNAERFRYQGGFRYTPSKESKSELFCGGDEIRDFAKEVEKRVQEIRSRIKRWVPD